MVSLNEAGLQHFQNAKAELNSQGWSVVTRKTGGSCCALDIGILNVSVIYRYAYLKRPSIETSYLSFCSKLADTLASLNVQCAIGPVPGAYCDGKYNLKVNGRKLVGTSQRWTNSAEGKNEIAVLNHATILVNANKREICQKINHFYRQLHLSDRVENLAIVNLNEIWKTETNEILMVNVKDRIKEMFDAN